MNGTYQCSRRYRALALSVLGGVGLASLAVPALASNQVNANVNPTTGYYEYGQRTFRAPPEVRIGNAPVTPSVVRVPNGMTQSLPGTVEIVGQKAAGLIGPPSQTLTGSVSSTLRAGAGAIKNGAARCLTSFRCNVAAMAASASLGALLDSIDGLIEDGGRLNIPDPDSIHTLDGRVPSGAGGWRPRNPGQLEGRFYSPEAACRAYISYLSSNYTYHSIARSGNDYQCRRRTTGNSWTQVEWISYYGAAMECPSGYNSQGNTCVAEPKRKFATNVPEVESLLDNWDFQPSDWSWVTGGIDPAHPEFEFTEVDIPSLTGEADPNFIEWSDGTSQGTYNEFDFSVSGVPGKQPSIGVKSTERTTEFDAQGNPTGSSTSTTNYSSSTAPPPDIPTDCEFMPTVCRFIDWFTEPDPSPDPDQEIRDLVQVYEDGGREVVLGPSTGSCPPPRVIALSFVPAVEVSFQPFCDLAAAVRFWLLAIAYFGAAYLTVRSI